VVAAASCGLIGCCRITIAVVTRFKDGYDVSLRKPFVNCPPRIDEHIEAIPARISSSRLTKCCPL